MLNYQRVSKYTKPFPIPSPNFPHGLSAERPPKNFKGYGHFTQSCPAGLARKVGAPGMVT